MHIVECIEIENRTQRTAVANCSYPFGLTITRDNYYWTDWISYVFYIFKVKQIKVYIIHYFSEKKLNSLEEIALREKI